MSLREDLLKSNGITSAGSSSQGPAPSSSLRAKLLADNKITQSTGPTGPVATTNRDMLLQKNKIGQFANATGPTGPAPVVPTTPKPGLMGDTTISSPEYFSKSVDVISPKGKFVATFTGNDAYEQAKVKADEVGGITKVTPTGGFLGRAANKIKDTIGGAVNDFADKTVQALGLNDQRITNLQTGERSPARNDVQVGADALRAGLAGVNVVFSPISALFSAAEEVPVLKYPAEGINYLFGKLGEAGNWAGDKVVNTLPVSDATKETIKPAAEELGALLAQIAGGKLGAKGLKEANVRTADLRNQIKENITKDVVTTHNLPATVYIDSSKIKSIFQTGDKISPE